MGWELRNCVWWYQHGQMGQFGGKKGSDLLVVFEEKPNFPMLGNLFEEAWDEL